MLTLNQLIMMWANTPNVNAEIRIGVALLIQDANVAKTEKSSVILCNSTFNYKHKEEEKY